MSAAEAAGGPGKSGRSAKISVALCDGKLAEELEKARPMAPGLEHVTLLQGTKAYGGHVGPMVVPGRERAPRHPHENFYWRQEDLLRDMAGGDAFRWTILRPVHWTWCRPRS